MQEIIEAVKKLRRIFAQVYIDAQGTPFKQEAFDLRKKMNECCDDLIAEKQPFRDVFQNYLNISKQLQEFNIKVEDYIKAHKHE